MIKLHAFRIKNFRSISDTGFNELSPDSITLLIGQNESGKSSILDALRSYETGIIIEDDIRSNGDMPEVTCIFKYDNIEEITDLFEEDTLPKSFEIVFKKFKNCISIKKSWELGKYKEGIIELENPEFKKLWSIDNLSKPQNKDAILKEIINEKEFCENIWADLPHIEIFEDNSILPAQIDVDDLVNRNVKAEGYEGAKNYLSIAAINPKDLLNPSSIRIVSDLIDEKNKLLNQEFQKYWNQTVGKKDKIEIILELKNHSNNVEGKQGKPYLTFWIKDKNGRLSPVQRSKGVKWFISFYLKLAAHAKQYKGRIFLIDEPGSNLHAKAQKDILNLFEKVKSDLQIIFSSHSPYLLDVNKIHRVLAVERSETLDEKSTTKIFPFQNLGSASVDTLFPLYTNMGVDISHQTIIKKANNFIVEEISAFFYMKAFWTLFNLKKEVSFLPATGCTNVPILANLMLGWGISFAIILDDDSSGRMVFNDLKKSHVCEENKLIKIKGCNGIEDLFTQKDFTKLILNNSNIDYSISNSEYLKKQKCSKVVIARDFMLKVLEGKIKDSHLSNETKVKIQELLNRMISTL